VTATDLVPQLAESLTCASWRLKRDAVRELAPLGLTFGQSRALRLLARAGEPLRIGDLAARLEVVPRTATTMVDSLESAGLVRRQADPSDRRSVQVGLTADGLALIERMTRARRQSAETMFAHLSPAHQAELLELLRRLNERGAPAGAAGPAGSTARTTGEAGE
jgi:DNA-binding MarR family transcriptional regulator